MLNELLGAVVAILVAGLIGVVFDRGLQIKALHKHVADLATRAERSEHSEKDLRTMIDSYNGRPFVIHLSDPQINNLAEMLMAAMATRKQAN